MTLERQAAETWERDTLSNKSLASEYLTLHEFIKAAKMNVSPKIWDYLVGGTETETTLARNRASLDAIALRPRVLRDVSNVDATSELFGRRVRLPVILAPVGSLESFADGGAVTVAEGAGRFGVAMMMSSVTQQTMEAVRAATAGPLVYQLYVRGDADFVDNEIAKCQDLGFDGFCITVDTQHYSRRERDISKRFIKSWRHADPTMITSQMAFNWSDIARIRPSIKVPFALKGIGTPEDARIAIEHGVDVIYCSNHGGRQLDHGRGSADVVQEILEVCEGRATVLMDGSVSRGTDVVKAIASGCAAAGVGRLYCYALAAEGADGIVRMLEILENEIVTALGLTGVTSFGELDRSYLHFGAPLVAAAPGVHSAFPLLNLDDDGYGGR